ncbi:MAG: hypothetical protein AB9880_01335 [Christensenellales bacterium]
MEEGAPRSPGERGVFPWRGRPSGHCPACDVLPGSLLLVDADDQGGFRIRVEAPEDWSAGTVI